MDGREFDRQAVAIVDVAAALGLRRAADGVDGGFVVAAVAGGVGLGQRGFAQHVEGIAEAAIVTGLAGAQGGFDRLAADELFAHHAHGDIDCTADQRFAAACDQAGERARQAVLAFGCDQVAGDDQSPGGGVDEQRATPADMRQPVASADAVADQRVAGCGVGDAQKGLGQAHQGYAFPRGQREFLHQCLDPARAAAVAQCAGQSSRGGASLGRQIGRQGRVVDQGAHAFDLGPAQMGGDALAGRVAGRQGGAQGGGWRYGHGKKGGLGYHETACR